jgi:hypothetical protein
MAYLHKKLGPLPAPENAPELISKTYNRRARYKEYTVQLWAIDPRHPKLRRKPYGIAKIGKAFYAYAWYIDVHGRKSPESPLFKCIIK